MIDQQTDRQTFRLLELLCATKNYPTVPKEPQVHITPTTTATEDPNKVENGCDCYISQANDPGKDEEELGEGQRIWLPQPTRKAVPLSGSCTSNLRGSNGKY